MTGVTLTHRTTDGREFASLEDAQAHAALLEKIERFMNVEDIADGARNKTRKRIVAFLDFDAATKDEEREAA